MYYIKNGEQKMKKTKIVCTIGPASNDEETLREMLLKIGRAHV